MRDPYLKKIIDRLPLPRKRSEVKLRREILVRRIRALAILRRQLFDTLLELNETEYRWRAQYKATPPGWPPMPEAKESGYGYE